VGSQGHGGPCVVQGLCMLLENTKASTLNQIIPLQVNTGVRSGVSAVVRMIGIDLVFLL